MKKLSLLIPFLLLSVAMFAQKKIDVVYLENGSVIKGNLSQGDSSKVKIETCCGNIFVFEMTEVRSIEQMDDPGSKYSTKKKGYLNFTSMGILLGSSSNEKNAPFSMLSEHNYRFNSYIAIGGLIGYELLQEPVMPLAGNIKLFLPLQQSDLFLGLTSGYSFSLENPESEFFETNTGGVLFNAEFGIMFPISRNNSFFIAAGYRYNKLNYTRTDVWLGNVDREVSYNRISIRLGLTIY